MLTREVILEALKNALEPLDYVQAMWEGGSASFNRVDEWSDIDLLVAAEDERVENALAVVDETLQALSPIELRYELTQPAWHGHGQVFYRLNDTSPFLMIDLVILKVSSTNRFLERQIHGDALIYFDKIGFVQPSPLSAEAHLKKIQARLETQRIRFDLFQSHVEKELNRGNTIEALYSYEVLTLRPLVEVLRIQYDPVRYDFHTRYLDYYFPPDVVKRLESLFFVADIQQLALKWVEAQQFFREALAQVDLDNIAQQLETVTSA